MKRVCAWCHKLLGYVQFSGMDPDEITHGICTDCAAKLLAEDHASESDDPLQGSEVPALLIGEDLRIRAVNELACQLLNKSHQALMDHLAGEAIDCIHSMEPGGCGKTPFCQNCNIRHSMLKTRATGESCQAVAYPTLQPEGQVSQIFQMDLSTQKYGDDILLCIENVRPLTPGP